MKKTPQGERFKKLSRNMLRVAAEEQSGSKREKKSCRRSERTAQQIKEALMRNKERMRTGKEKRRGEGLQSLKEQLKTGLLPGIQPHALPFQFLDLLLNF